jgi:hypothetical protein
VITSVNPLYAASADPGCFGAKPDTTLPITVQESGSSLEVRHCWLDALHNKRLKILVRCELHRQPHHLAYTSCHSVLGSAFLVYPSAH